MSKSLSVWLVWSLVALIALFQPNLFQKLWVSLVPLQFRALLQRWAAAIIRKKWLCCAAAGLAVLAIRVLIIPFVGIPTPYVHDEFAYLLQADTFAHGRLTNPTHPYWPFFESLYLLQVPTYNAKYPPAQGMAMAAGQWALGHPWFGVWLSCGVLAAALCWALQGWVSNRWAILGTCIGLPMCLFTPWMDSYWGGSVTATGGALVFGGFARLVRGHKQALWPMSLGALIMVASRPYEAVVFLLGTGVALSLRLRPRLLPMLISRSVWIAPLLIAVSGAAWLGYYNYRVTGHVLRLPYQEYAQQYTTTPQFIIAPVGAPRKYPHIDFDMQDQGWEREVYDVGRTWRHFFVLRPADWLLTASGFLGHRVMLIPTLLIAPFLWRSKKVRILGVFLVSWFAGSLLVGPYFAHYAAPWMCVVVLLSVQTLRYLRFSRFKAGPFLATAIPTAMLLLTAKVQLLRAMKHEPPYTGLPSVAQKGLVEERMLKQVPGKHLVFVHYTNYTAEPHYEWTYNSADIDQQDVIWAQDMGPEKDAELMHYYQGRHFWTLEPDFGSTTPFPLEAPPAQGLTSLSHAMN